MSSRSLLSNATPALIIAATLLVAALVGQLDVYDQGEIQLLALIFGLAAALAAVDARREGSRRVDDEFAAVANLRLGSGGVHDASPTAREHDRGMEIQRPDDGRMSGSDEAARVLPGPTGEITVASPRDRRRRLLRKAIFGDWHPYLLDPLDLLRLSFGGAAVVFLVVGSLEYAVRLAGTFLVLVAAQRLRMPRLFDLLFIVAMGLQAWGNAGRLFDDVDWWDNLVHFVIPLSSVPVLYVLNWRLGLLPAMAEVRVPRQRLGLVVFAVVTGLSIAAVYEIYEFVAVRWLDAGLAIGYTDTITDLALGVGGAFAGGLLLMLWSAENWPTGRQPLP